MRARALPKRPFIKTNSFLSFLSKQTRRHLHQKVHPAPIPRSRPEQGRVRVPGPLREQVLRGQRQGFGEDAGRGAGEAGRWVRLEGCWGGEEWKGDGGDEEEEED
jgi:hypothetical protein